MGYFSLFLMSLFPILNASLASTNPTEIITRGDALMRGKTTQILMTMKVHRPEYTRELKLRSWTSSDKKTLVEILKPAKEEGISSLRVEESMWNYLPKTDQVVRIPTSMMLQSWMGSDFTNDDLMKLSSIRNDYSHKILKKDKLNGQDSVVIECIPKEGAPIVWGKILYWARTQDDLPIKEEYYDESGKLIRTLVLQEIKKMDDRIIPTQLIIRKAQSSEEYTEIRYEKILYDRKVSDALFQKDRLRSNSQEGKQESDGWSVEPLS